MPSALLYFGADGVSNGAFRLLLPPVDRCTGVIPSSLLTYQQQQHDTLARLKPTCRKYLLPSQHYVVLRRLLFCQYCAYGIYSAPRAPRFLGDLF